MRTSKILKRLAKKEGVSISFVETEIQKAIDMADWHECGKTRTKPKSIEEAITRIKQQVKKKYS